MTIETVEQLREFVEKLVSPMEDYQEKIKHGAKTHVSVENCYNLAQALTFALDEIDRRELFERYMSKMATPSDAMRLENEGLKIGAGYRELEKKNKELQAELNRIKNIDVDELAKVLLFSYDKYHNQETLEVWAEHIKDSCFYPLAQAVKDFIVGGKGE